MVGTSPCPGMDTETNHILSTRDRTTACTMRACDDYEHTVARARLLSRRWPPNSRQFASELEAMRWINSRLVLHGFEEAYRLGKEK